MIVGCSFIYFCFYLLWGPFLACVESKRDPKQRKRGTFSRANTRKGEKEKKRMVGVFSLLERKRKTRSKMIEG
jgi:hypothetical protein